MSIGVISLSTSQKKEIITIPPSGFPFTAGSAHNGVSIDAAGKVVLGNDAGDPGAPAILLNDREIDMQTFLNKFQLILIAGIDVVRTFLTGSKVQVDPGDGGIAQIIAGGVHLGTQALITALSNDFGVSTILARNTVDGFATIAATLDNAGLGGIAGLQVNAGANDQLHITTGDVPGRVQFRVRGLFTTMAINTATFCTLIQSNTPSAFNGATLQVSGTHTYRKFDQSQNGILNLNRDTDSAKYLRNSGALTINFPNMAGANFREGFFIDVLVTDAAGITINAGAATTIKFGSLATSVNGAISSTDVGAFIRIIIIDTTTYATCFFVGVWTLT
jgi:hypothetical protein